MDAPPIFVLVLLSAVTGLLVHLAWLGPVVYALGCTCAAAATSAELTAVKIGVPRISVRTCIYTCGYSILYTGTRYNNNTYLVQGFLAAYAATVNEPDPRLRESVR